METVKHILNMACAVTFTLLMFYWIFPAYWIYRRYAEPLRDKGRISRRVYDCGNAIWYFGSYVGWWLLVRSLPPWAYNMLRLR